MKSSLNRLKTLQIVRQNMEQHDDDIKFLENTIQEAVTESPAPSINPYSLEEGFALNTPVLCFNGDVKPIHSLSQGDVIMGDDNTPRSVVSVQTGSCSSFFKVKQNKGADYIINRNNFITLKLSRIKPNVTDVLVAGKKYMKNDYVDIKLQDYLALSKSRKRDLMAIKHSVDFSFQPIKLNPYVFGLWVVDAADTNLSEVFIHDIDILSIVLRDLERDDMKLDFVRDNRFLLILNNGRNFIEEILTPLGITETKFIPSCYKCNDNKTRLQVLAGVIDCAGYLNTNCYELTIKNETVANDIIFICLSVGLYASKRELKSKSYFRIIISGDLSIIPTKFRSVTERKQIKNIAHTGIIVESILDANQCVKIVVDGNGRFLLGDFTVAHS